MAALTVKERNRRRFLRDKSDPRHGTANGYVNLTCRCQRCRAAWADYHLVYLHTHPEQRRKLADRNLALRGSKRQRPYTERPERWRKVTTKQGKARLRAAA